MNPLLFGSGSAAEPYEDSQVGSPRSIHDSLPEAEALRQFYETQERERLERKLSKRSSTKSKHRNEQRKRPSLSSPPPQQSAPPPMQASRESLVDKTEYSDMVPPMLLRTIVPDPLNELPAWYKREEMLPPANPLSFKLKYPIHNPVGPRFYRNHHLLPPKGAVRPKSFFSPSFPPMASFHTRSQESRLSRTPSGSPLPTPTSSQADIGKRSRKTSQTTPDNVDLLDVTDPSGQNWHHTSPYDLNISTNSSPETQEVPRPRLTSSATTRTSRPNRAVAPSPLSQSTSAIHLHVQDDSIRVTRRLSKRRTPVFGNLFGAPRDPKNKPGSLPTSPVDPNAPVRVALHDPPLSQQKRSSTMPISASAISLPSSKKERRSSLLGRLVKKFSLMRKPVEHVSNGDWHHVESHETQRQSSTPNGLATPKRVPPPQPPQDSDQRSSVSVELPARGRLTVANPDAPSSTTSATPIQRPITLPPEIIDQIIIGSPAAKEPATIESVAPTPIPKSPAPLPNRASHLTVTDNDATPKPPHLPLRTSMDRSLPPTPLMEDTRSVSMSSTVANPPTTAYYQESPLSTASMIVNPPTPAATERVISSVTAKETETFKMVRSPSGSMVVNGEGWEVVEKVVEPKEKKERGKNRSSEKERSRASEKEKVNRLEKEKSKSREKEESKKLSKSKSERHSTAKSEKSRHKHSASTTSVDKTLPDASLERNSSSASRPLSEMPSAAEMSSVKAREAYELERLWKARSMYNADQPSPNNRYVPSDNSSPIPESIRTIHGSSHTSFTVSSPFQSPAPLPNGTSHYLTHSQRQAFQSAHSDPVIPTGRLMNKLPPPPQESPYQSPLVTSLKDPKWLTTTAH